MSEEPFRSSGGWCAPTDPDYFMAEDVDIPRAAVRRGGIQWPQNIVVNAHVKAIPGGWLRRSRVDVTIVKSWVRNGLDEGSLTIETVARFWRWSKATDLADFLRDGQ